MRINNNMLAINTHRQMGIAGTNQAKSMEKLSSGSRINRAGDDAAGLSISEKMRGQIRGLTQASRNAQDGISLIQTAEGALNETHAILQRMRELSVQAASDTNVEKDREEIQKEITQLTSEVNRIGNTTEFNTMKLVNGDRSATKGATMNTDTKVANVVAADLAYATGVVETNGGVNIKGGEIKLDATGAAFAGLTATTDSVAIAITKGADGIKVSLTGATGTEFKSVDDIVADEDGNFNYKAHGVEFTITKEDFEAMDAAGTMTITATGTEAGTGAKSVKSDFTQTTAGTEATVEGFAVSRETGTGFENITEVSAKWVGTAGAGKLTVTVTDASGKISTDDITLAAGTHSYDAHGIKFDFDAKDATAVDFKLDLKQEVIKTPFGGTDESLSFQVGANENQAMSLSIGDMRSDALGISSTSGGGAFASGSKGVTDGTDNAGVEHSLDVSTHKAAAASVTIINDAIEKVSGERSKLGAVQNRLEHTIKNLDTSAENLQASEARIRDVDMAKEMMNLTKQNILQQASQAMLAQANQAPQGVLQLLR